MPVLGDNLIQGIEIVDRTIVDTTTLQDGRKQYNQYLTITSFTDSPVSYTHLTLPTITAV